MAQGKHFVLQVCLAEHQLVLGETVLAELRLILQEKIGLPSDPPLPILSPRAFWEELRSNPGLRSSPGT
jgi:hypothetical protein